MHLHRFGARAHKVRRAWIVAAGLGLLSGAFPCFAQTPAAVTGTDAAPSEAVRRQALSPYRFILQNANAPARKAAPAPAPAPSTEAKRVTLPTAAPIQQAAVEPARAVTPLPTAAPAAEPANPPALAPVAALTPPPVAPPPIIAVRREIVPLQTDEPRLPAALLRERPSGVVRVAFEVKPDGSTAAVRIVSSTNRALNRASVDAVSGWKFEPVDEVLSVETELAYKYD